MFWEIVGFSAAALTAFGFLPQVIKIYKTKSCQDISALTLIQFAVGIFLWLLYGLHLRNMVIISANAITLVIIMIGVVLYARYKK
jgi:MtN3 and saliva related transmembrane protein